MPVEPLQIESVVDRVYAALRARILSGDLHRGRKLRQEALAEELGVSRTPLREALRRLAAEGLVEFHANRGAHVADLEHEDVRSAYEARLALEPGAARLAAARRSAQELRAMRAAVAAQERGEDWLETSRAFHLALVRASGNEYLIRLAEALWVPAIAQAIYEQQLTAPDRRAADLDEHERITAAIAAGDAELADGLTRRHIESSLGQLLGT
jgi:DNA-binding GntR family transcriptional regulator